MNNNRNEKTINELKERLAQLDELTILELLDISSEELVEFLTDQVIERYDTLVLYLEDEQVTGDEKEWWEVL